jgi:mRNA interferase MazF
MQKDFDTWNKQKKSIDSFVTTPFYKEREIWACFLGTNVGFEQDGKGKQSVRPVVILRGFSRNVCLVVPLTTSTKKNPYHIDIGSVAGKQAYAIISQLRLIDTKRLLDRLDFLEINLFDVMKKAIKDFL